MAEPSGPINGQNRVVEGLVSAEGVAGLKKGSRGSAVTGSIYQALDAVVDVDAIGGAALALGQAAMVASVPVVIASNQSPVPISGTVDTELPAAAALADNAANPTAPAVGSFAMVWDGAAWNRAAGSAADGALVNLGANNDVVATGAAAVDAVVSGSPVAVAGRASNTVPSAVSADGDVVIPWLHRTGAQVVASAPHVGMLGDPFALTAKSAQFTTAQTGIALWTPGTGKRIIVTMIQIQAGGTTAATVQVWFGGAADTTYTRGTDLAIFDGEFAPSATLKPGVVLSGMFPAGAVDHVLRLTTNAAATVTVTAWGYEV